jgi:hypothetical protein
MMKRTVWALLLATLLAAPAGAVVLDDTNRITIQLADGTQVVLLGEAIALSAERSNRYYYLPVNVRLSKRPDGTPEFLFLKFTTDKAASQGGVSGGLMHFLMEWGLTPQQEEELRAKLKTQKAELVGAAPLEDVGDGGSFQIVSATLSDKGMTTSLVTSGKAPLLPGGKAAAASRLTAEGAQLLAATFEKAKSITDLSIALNYGYQTLTPAARGAVTVDWSKLIRERDSLVAEYSKTRTGTTVDGGCILFACWATTSGKYSYSYSEMRNQWKFLEEKKVIDIKFDEQIADERVAKIREAFFQFFLNKMAEPVKDEAPPPATDKEKEQTPDIKYGAKYRFKRESQKYMSERRVETFTLNYRLAVRWPFQVVGNLASWYDGVKDNPRCVAAVNLNDPFFQHRSINFILDLDAKEMFDEAVNYVTVNVRKARSSGAPFEDRVTMDAKFVKEKGITASVTYARGDDRNADTYEYQAQWSLKGGNVYPATPRWEKGSWEGVTLAPPVVPRKIEVEGDLEAMKASGISRVTVQIHYSKFGQEVEENIHISPAKNEPIVTQKIFMDRGAAGYAYRLIVNHKSEGKLVLPWNARVGDDYIYATIPEDLLQEGSALKAEAKRIGETAVDTAKERVLDQFKELLGGRPRS